jgi:catechol 2,3-dioxygenase-like lactoylglutathione lyase family enzyme
MALKHIVGLDHVVILVRDLDRAADNWRRLGFTLAPRGTHSAPMGTGNHTIMLGPDYLELIGVLAETPHNAPSRALLDRRGDGIERAALTTTDAAAGVEEIRARGLAGVGSIDFGRPVTLPDGSRTEARFRIFQWPLQDAPAGLRIFACEHLTREAVWVPDLQKHANGAKRIARVEIVTPDPQREAEHMARLLDQEVQRESDGAVRVPTGRDRGAFVFLTRDGLAGRYPTVPTDGLPSDGAASLVLVTEDLNAAARALGAAALRSDDAVCVPPAAANGVLLVFVRE